MHKPLRLRAAHVVLRICLCLSFILMPAYVLAQDAEPTPAIPAEGETSPQLYLPLLQQPAAAAGTPPGGPEPGEEPTVLINHPLAYAADLELTPNSLGSMPAQFEAALLAAVGPGAAQQEHAAAALLPTIIDLPLALQQAISQGVLDDPRAAGAGKTYMISTYRSEGNWGQAIAVPQDIVDAGWEVDFSDDELIELLSWRGPSGRYYTYAKGSEGFRLLAAAVPAWFAEYTDPMGVERAAALAEDYLFPWTSGQKWFKNGGWHPVSGGTTGNAIDFQPQIASGDYAIKYAVLAPISGTVTKICGPDSVGQSSLKISSSEVGTTKILHMDDASIPTAILNKSVARGQYLGHSHLPNKETDKGCGYGAARHIHVVLPTKEMKINGYAANDVAAARSATLYESSNRRVDNHLANVTVAGIWTNDGGSNWDTNKTSFRPGEAIRYVAAIKNNSNSALPVHLQFEASGPSGRIAYYAGTHSTGTGTQLWGLGATIPANAASGSYTLRVTVTYNGASSSRSTTFTVQTIDCGSRYKAEYYSNRDLAGSSPDVVCEGWPISHDWGNSGPGGGVPSDNFSARWTGTATFGAGRYRFVAEADDGVRVWFDDTLIINEWRDQGTTTFRHERDVTAGAHRIRVEYYERGGGAVARFRWEQVTGGGTSGNIARGRPSYSSSQESTEYGAGKANDGSTGTRWSSRISTSLETQWWYVDLGGKPYSKVRVNWEHAYGARHFIGWSNDCANFNGYEFTISGPGVYTYDIGNHSERCVGIFMLQRAPRMNNYSIWEIEVASGSFAASAEVGGSVDGGMAADSSVGLRPAREEEVTYTVPGGAAGTLYLPVITD